MPREILCVTQDGIDSDNTAAMNLLAKSIVYKLITTKDLKSLVLWLIKKSGHQVL